MKIEYWQEYDALYIRLKEDVPETTGAEVAPGIVFHYSESREVVSIEMDSRASKLVDLDELRIEGLPVSVMAAKKVAGYSRRIPFVYPRGCDDYTIGSPCFSKILNDPVPIATRFPSSS